MGERIRALWERLRADFHKNPGLWIGVGISAAILVIAYLAYRSQSQGSVPANGYGFPDYGSANGGTDSSGSSGYSPYQPVSPIQPFAPGGDGVSSPPVATPGLPFQLPSGGSWLSSDSGAAAAGPYQVQGAIQNPLAPAQQAHAGAVQTPTSALGAMTSAQSSGLSAGNQQAHRGVTPSSAVKALASVVTSGRSAANQEAHRGTVSHPAMHAPAPHVVVPKVQHIYTTNRSKNSGKGRVA